MALSRKSTIYNRTNKPSISQSTLGKQIQGLNMNKIEENLSPMKSKNDTRMGTFTNNLAKVETNNLAKVETNDKEIYIKPKETVSPDFKKYIQTEPNAVVNSTGPIKKTAKKKGNQLARETSIVHQTKLEADKLRFSNQPTLEQRQDRLEKNQKETLDDQNNYTDHYTGKKCPKPSRYQSLPINLNSMKSYENLHDTLVNQINEKQHKYDDFVTNKLHRNWSNLNKSNVANNVKSLDRSQLKLSGQIKDDKPQALPYLYHDYRTQKYNDQYIKNKQDDKTFAEILRLPQKRKLPIKPEYTEDYEYYGTRSIAKQQLSTNLENNSLKISLDKQLASNTSLTDKHISKKLHEHNMKPHRIDRNYNFNPEPYYKFNKNESSKTTRAEYLQIRAKNG